MFLSWFWLVLGSFLFFGSFVFGFLLFVFGWFWGLLGFVCFVVSLLFLALGSVYWFFVLGFSGFWSSGSWPIFLERLDVFDWFGWLHGARLVFWGLEIFRGLLVFWVLVHSADLVKIERNWEECMLKFLQTPHRKKVKKITSDLGCLWLVGVLKKTPVLFY